MMAATGVDNRDLLPPFAPMVRNDDGIFGITLRSCLPDSCIGHVPRVVRHNPPGSWTFDDDDIWQKIVRLRLSDFLGRLIGQCRYGPEVPDARTRLERLGRYLRGIGGLPRADFEDMLRVERWRHLSECARHLEAELDLSDPPGHIAEDMQRCLEHIAETCRSDECVAPVDVEERGGIDDATGFLADSLTRFGELLEAWPTVIDGARRLREKGIRPARPVS